MKTNSFENFNLNMKILRGIFAHGFTEPSEIQNKTIPVIISGKDILAQSQSGTGKTGAFVIGCLSRIDPTNKRPQAILIANTRSLVCQIMKVVANIAIDMNIGCCLCIGGGGFATQTENIKSATNSHVLIGTPGRICDLLGRNIFDKTKVKIMVIDEADELLKPDFEEQLNFITSQLKTSQKCLFSATFSKESLQRIERTKMLNNPFRITVEKEKLSLETVRQFKINVKYRQNKFEVLDELFNGLCIAQMIIFVNSSECARELRNRLMDNRGIEAGLVTGGMDNLDRETILKEFRLAKIKTLITTDIMCRGIDVDDLRIVINYDIAHDANTYLHRIGRSGRYGSEGIAINFCTYDDVHRIRMMEQHFGIQISDLPSLQIVNNFLNGITVPESKVGSGKMYDNDD